MIPQGFYKNGAFISEFEDRITDSSNLYYQVAEDLFVKDGIKEKILDITPNSVNLDFDSFNVKTKENLYLVKLSFDEDSFFLKNESEFLKNNKHPMLPKYVSSCVFKMGENLRYLIYEYDVGLDLADVGRCFVYEKRINLLNCLKILRDFKSHISFSDYSEFIFDHFDISKSLPDIVDSNIYPVHQKEKIENIFSKIKEYFYSSLDLNSLNGDGFCNGNLNEGNITTNGHIFKFNDFHCSFKGNPFLDVCFMSLNLSYNQLMFNNLMKDFCEVNELSYEESKDNLRDCLSAACCILLYKKLAEFLVEQCVYENSREDKVVSILFLFDNAQWCFKKLPFYESIKEDFKEIYESPTRIL